MHLFAWFLGDRNATSTDVRLTGLVGHLIVSICDDRAADEDLSTPLAWLSLDIDTVSGLVGAPVRVTERARVVLGGGVDQLDLDLV